MDVNYNVRDLNPARQRIRFILILHNGNRLEDTLGAEVSVGTKRTFLLLTLLAENEGVKLPRKKVAETIWPESEPQAARNSLRTALSALRKTLPGGALWSDVDRISMVKGAVLLGSSPLDGNFMPDFNDDWVIERRLKDRDMAVQQLLTETCQLSEDGHLEAALKVAESACERDPLSDIAAKARIAILEKLGRHSKAAILSHGHRTRMLRELGAVSEVSAQPSDQTSPLTHTARWLLERDPIEALAFLTSTKPHWEIAPANESLAIHSQALEAAPFDARYRANVEAQALYAKWCLHGAGMHLSEAKEAMSRALAARNAPAAYQLAKVVAFSQLSAGNFAEALATTKTILDIAESEQGREFRLDGKLAQAIIELHAGDHLNALSKMDRLSRLAEDVPSLIDSAHLWLMRATVAMFRQEFTACDEALQKARKAFQVNGGSRLLGFTALAEAELLESAGDTLRARQLLFDLISQGEDVLGQSLFAGSSDLLAKIDYRLGEYASAAAALETSDQYRKARATVASPLESRKLRPIRRKLEERFGSGRYRK